ncbi:hypothetical protein [Pantoea sp. USHLN256]|uniref:hypothetical protein n=1 Tax=Pantoea sp. USHLN256 TaxID=3081293 RepID=UPI00301AA448
MAQQLHVVEGSLLPQAATLAQLAAEPAEYERAQEPAFQQRLAAVWTEISLAARRLAQIPMTRVLAQLQPAQVALAPEQRAPLSEVAQSGDGRSSPQTSSAHWWNQPLH